MTTDFRDVLAEACARHFAVRPEVLAGVFPNHKVDAKNFAGFYKG